MWYKQRGDKVRYFKSWKDPVTGEYGTVSCTMPDAKRKTQDEAERILNLRIDAKRAQALQNAIPTKETIDVGQLRDMYLDHVEGTVRPQTYGEYASMTKGVVDILGKKTKVKELTALSVEKSIKEKDLSTKLKNQRIIYSRMMLRFAFEHDLIEKDISSAISKFREDGSSYIYEEGQIKKKFLLTEEIPVFLKALTGMYKDLAEVLILSGMRIGEARALRIEDIDLDKEEINITRNQPIDDTQAPGKTKTKTSTRKIYMQPELKALLKQIIKKSSDAKEKMFEQDDFLFVDYDTAIRPSYDMIRRKFSKAGKGIKKNVTCHMLRRTHASILYAAGIDKDTIARRLGHSPGSEDNVTMAIYVFVLPEREQKDRERIKGLKIL